MEHLARLGERSGRVLKGGDASTREFCFFDNPVFSHSSWSSLVLALSVSQLPLAFLALFLHSSGRSALSLRWCC